LYASETDANIVDINIKFAGIFATAYLGIETITKVLATVIFIVSPVHASAIIFSIYLFLSVVSVGVIAVLSDLKEAGTWNLKLETIFINSFSAIKLVSSDSALAFLVPFQVAFGFASSFVPYYILGTVINKSESLGTKYLGLLSAIIVLVGTVIAIPSSQASMIVGKPIMMTIGAICLAYTGFALLVFSDGMLGTWTNILIYLVIFGIGRGIWENTNKAVIADLYVDSKLSTTAFASITFFNGMAGAIGYFCFEHMVRLQMAELVMISSLLSIPCFIFSSYIQTRNTARISELSNVSLTYTE
jgi:hypothetical protein